ncbi:HTH-type transcriptional repressor RspR [Burkholderiales bacterium]|nr:HTH-type transcriptional repressor RspR [Burkholderiales bacterium]
MIDRDESDADSPAGHMAPLADDEPPARRPATLPSAVAERLRELITEGELAAGARLNERALGDRLGVSRTPLREAFRLLAADGLVVLEPNRGARVVALSSQDIRESFEVMGALEALAGELACARLTGGEVAEIKALTFEMLACHARADLPAYYRLNRAIHDRIALAAGNDLLRRSYASLNLRIQSLRFRSNFDRAKWDQAAHEHAQMVELLERRDGKALAALLRGHLAKKGEAVLEEIARAGARHAPLAGSAP